MAAATAQGLISHGRAILKVHRLGGFGGQASIKYELVNGTARGGIDFVASGGVVTWENGQAQPRSIVIPLINTGRYTAGVGRCESTLTAVLKSSPSTLPITGFSRTEVSILNTNAKRGSIQLPAALSVSELQETMTVNVSRVGGMDCAVTVHYRTVAIPSSDYGNYGIDKRDQQGSLSWAEGDASPKTLTLPIVDNDDLQAAPGEQFYLELYGAGGELLALGAAGRRMKVTVKDDDQIGFLRLDTTELVTRSDRGGVTVLVSRVFGTATPVTADYYTVADTAIAGTDFVPTSGTLVWRHGEFDQKGIYLAVKNNSADARLSTDFQLHIAYVTGTTMLDDVNVAVIRVINVYADPGVVGFQPSFPCNDNRAPPGSICYYVFEEDSFVSVYVRRTQGTIGDISAMYTAQNISANGFGDFTPVTGTLEWPSGDESVRRIDIPIRYDTAGFPILEFFRVELFDGDSLVPVVDPLNKYAYVAIIDKDGGGSITVAPNAPLAYESSGEARFVISRNGAGIGLASATYETLSGTAVPGVDFTTTQGEVFWADGEAGPKIISVPLTMDHASRFGLYFKDLYLHVTAVSSNVFLDPRSSMASVIVADDGAQTGFFLFEALDFDPLTGTTVGAPALYNVSEAAGVVRVAVARKGGVQGNVTLRYRTADGTALATRNYRAKFGYLNWDEGDAESKTIEIALIDDALFTPTTFSTLFQVILEDVTIHDGTLSSSSYTGPASVVAQVEIGEDDGPGTLAFEQSLVEVREGVTFVNFTVNRLGGSDRAVSVKYTTVAGTATTPFVSGSEGAWSGVAYPTSCAGVTSSGVTRIRVAHDIVREVYCDVSGGAGSESASMFLWDGSLSMWNRTCTPDTTGGGTRDHSILWRDLASRVSLNSNGSTSTGRFTKWVASEGTGGGASDVEDFSDVPAGVGEYARPVPFPANDIVVWFDWEHAQVVWLDANKSARHNASFDLLGLTAEDVPMDVPSFYFITDGISTVHVGRVATDDDDIPTNATLISFNFTTGTAVASNISSPMTLSPSEWCQPLTDAYGHVLWTVNGRVMYRNCSGWAGDGTTLAYILGGPIHEPMSLSEHVHFEVCPAHLFPECGTWSVNASSRSSGLDLFAAVDDAGFLYLGDAGRDGGVFRCETGMHLGTVRTGVELGHVIADDFTPTSGTLSWERDDTAPKTFGVVILDDGVVDGSVVESFSVSLFDVFKAGLAPGRTEVTVRIQDRQGPGMVDVVPDTPRAGERAFCCNNCEASFVDADRTWCTYFTAERSAARGAVCVQHATATAAGGDVPAEPATHFVPGNGTICWAHGDASPKPLVVELPYHPVYDVLFKTFNVSLLGLGAGNDAAMGSGYRGAGSEAQFGHDATQELVDEDAAIGVATFRADVDFGQNVFVVQTTESTALVYAIRAGGSDTDLAVTFSTEALPSGETLVLPAAVTVRDGSRGTNTFCVALSDRLAGSCADSSSNARCSGGLCTSLSPSTVSASTPGENYNPALGTIYWRQGESGIRAVPIRLYADPNGTSVSTSMPQNVTAAYRAFSVLLNDITSSRAGVAGPSRTLPGRNAHGTCRYEDCVASGPTEVTSACNSYACRKSASREAFVLTPAGSGAGQLRLVNSTYFITEDVPQNSVIFIVQRVGGTAGSVSVKYSTRSQAIPGVSVAAEEGHDYQDVNGTLVWEDADASDKEVVVPVINDESYTKGRLFKSFKLEIFNASGGADISGAASCESVIVDDDTTPGTIQVFNTRQTFSESAGRASLSLARVGGSDTAVYVRFHTGLNGVWDSVAVQSGFASAHPAHFAAQSYACQSTLKGASSASVSTSRAIGGGGADLAFDQNLTTFWDGSNGGAGGVNEWLLYDFAACELEGANVTGYSLRTAAAGKGSGCPAAWQFQGSADGVEWIVLDVQAGRACTPTGGSYALPQQLGVFKVYRWLWLSDVDGFNGVRVYEAGLEFANYGSEGAALLQAQVCDERDVSCCLFDSGSCDLPHGNEYESLYDMSYDYLYERGLVYWAEGDTQLKTINVSLLDDCMGCSESRCQDADQQQDKPHEVFPVQLTTPSDLEILALPGRVGKTYPYRRDARIDPSFSFGTVVIEDDDGPGVISLATTSCGAGRRAGTHVEDFVTAGGVHVSGNRARCPVLESAGTVEFIVQRSGGSRGSVTVTYEAVGVTGVGGKHFRAASGALTWSHGDSGSRFFSIEVFDVPGYQAGEYIKSFVARLKGVQHDDGTKSTLGGAELKPCTREVLGVCVDPEQSEFLVTLLDDDATPGTIMIDRADLPAADQYTVMQSEGFVVISVKRVGGVDMAVNVSYTTVEGTSSKSSRACNPGVDLAVCDFIPAMGVLSWADGDSDDKHVSVYIRSATQRSQRETFKFAISGKMNDTINEFCGGYGATFDAGARDSSIFTDLHCSRTFFSEVTVTVNSNPAGGVFQLYSHGWPFLIDDGAASIAVFAIERVFGSTGVVSVEARTEGVPYYGTADPSVHFEAIQETYSWYDKDTGPRFVRVPILADTVPDNTLVELRVRLNANSKNAGLDLAKTTARLFIKPVDFIPQFLATSIGDTTNVLDLDNPITFSFRTNVIAGPDAVVTISELANTNTPSGTIALSGAHAVIFGSSGVFDQAAGTMTLTVAYGKTIDPGMDVSATFTLRNGGVVQQRRIATIRIDASSSCTRPSIGGVALACPSSFQVAPVSMVGRLLGYIVLSVVTPTVLSNGCTFPSCEHSPLFLAYNNITVALTTPNDLAAGSTITIKGLQASTSEGPTVPVYITNVSRTTPTYKPSNKTMVCSCLAAGCTCESAFQGIPRANDLRLQIEMQCNALGWLDLSGETLTVQIGDDTFLTSSNGLGPIPRSCEDNCSVYHNIFPTYKDVTQQVSPTGQLFVAITSSARTDYCGAREYLRARVTVHWTSGVLDMLKGDAAWNPQTGQLVYTVPAGYKVSKAQRFALYFPLRNPAGVHAGSALAVEVNTPGGVKAGPTPVVGVVMEAARGAAVAVATLEESTTVQGAENVLVLKIAFNARIGGLSGGLWVTVSGLTGTQTPDTDSLPIELCTLCQFSRDTYQDLPAIAGNEEGKITGTGRWNQERGELSFWLRGPQPTFSIAAEEGNLIGMIRVVNAGAAQAGADATLTVAGELVAGSGAPAAFAVETDLPILTAGVSMEVFSNTLFGYASVDGYARPDAISISFTANHALNYGDRIIISVPGLTTCEMFCADGACEEIGCEGISGFYLDAAEGSVISGGNRNFFEMSWDESAKEMSLTSSGGRAVCANNSFAFSLTPASYSCEDFQCALKALPDDIAASRGSRTISTNALGCRTASEYCSPPTSSSFTNIPVKVMPGAYWGQRTANLSMSVSGEANGRAWFAAQEHKGALYILGGLSSDGFAQTTRVSRDGVKWDNTHTEEAPLPFGARAYFSSASFLGQLWVTGGRSASGAVMNDVWRSADGVSWVRAAARAKWPARAHHVSLAHRGRLYVIAGTSSVGGADVWASYDGVNFEVVTWHAEFGPRTGHGVVSHAGYMWLYGGGLGVNATSEVWKSADGSSWSLVTDSAAWEVRNVWSAVAFDNRLWVLGGYAGKRTFRDVWWSYDGVAWVKVLEEAHWGGRFGARAVSFNNRLWVLGGSTTPCDEDGITACAGAVAESVCKGFWRDCHGNDAWSDAFATSNFVTLEASGSTTVVGADNSIGICAAMDRLLPAEAVFQVTGLNHGMPSGALVVRGRDAALFAGFGAWDATTGVFTLTAGRDVVPFEEVCVSFVIVNGPVTPGGEEPVLGVSALARSDRFSVTHGRTFLTVVGDTRGGNHELSTRNPDAVAPMVFDGGVMFDVEVLRSTYVTGFSVGLQPQAVGQNVEQELFVYYKEGSHTAAPLNMSEWRLLGTVLVPPEADHNDFAFKVRDLHAFQVQEGPNASRTLTSMCPAGSPLLGACDATGCVSATPRTPRDASFGEDSYPFDYTPERFCVGETYCDDAPDGACVCSVGDAHACTPGYVEPQGWLGPQGTWAENTSEFMSSSLVRGVNISGVLSQDPDALWCSGEGVDKGISEAGCIHLPLCPEEWPYDKDQFLAFDFGICHTLSRFRSSYPTLSQAPTFYYKGVERRNIRDEYWQQGHFKDFEFQYSSEGLAGPWKTVLADAAEMQAEGWQEHSFEPATARYWRLLMKTNHGFGYTALQSLEFFGFESIWCHQSKWCHESMLCPSGAPDKMAVFFEPDEAIRPRGFALTAGAHSFYMRSTHGLNVTKSARRRGDALKSDGRLLIKEGTIVEHSSPVFAWEAPPHPVAYQVVDAQSATAPMLNTPGGFTVVARFDTPPESTSAEGALLSLGGGSLGVGCEGALRVRVSGGSVGVEQGCVGASSVEVGGSEGFYLAAETSYCYIASFNNGTLTQRLERAVPLDTENATWKHAPFDLTALAPFDSVTVGAALGCGNASFGGEISGVAVYQGQLEGASVSGACRRRCPAVTSDGSCYEPANLVHEQALLTAGASSFSFMRLPAPPACYSRFRLEVTSAPGPRWCLQELSFFADAAPFYHTFPTPNSSSGSGSPRASASSYDPAHPPAGAFDLNASLVGGPRMGGDAYFCSAQPDGWVEFDFGEEACLEGYAIKSLASLEEDAMPSAWTLKGSNDAVTWHVVDSRAGEAFGESSWRRFHVRTEAREFLFVTNFFNASLAFGHNTLSRLYAWTGPASGFVLQQEVPTKGARGATHFEADGEHFLAVAGMLDGSVSSQERVNDMRSSDSQVGSSIFVWAPRTATFSLHETLPTNNSAALHFFTFGETKYLLSADNRAGGPSHANTHEGGQSILYARTASTSGISGDSGGNCVSCACGTTLEGGSSDSAGGGARGPVVLVFRPESGAPSSAVGTQRAFDGDYNTSWLGMFDEAKWVIENATFSGVDNVTLETEAAGLALAFNFTTCEGGAEVTGYSIVSGRDSCARSWTLEASSDGSVWQSLDRVEAAEGSDACVPFFPRSYNVDAPGVYNAYRLRFGPGRDANGTLVFGDVSISEVEMTFANEGNTRFLYGENGAITEYDYEPAGPPYRSVYRDADGGQVPRFRKTGFETVGVFGTLFDLTLLDGHAPLVNASVCGLNDTEAPKWDDPWAPFRACSAEWDRCEAPESPVCFAAENRMGACAGGNRSSHSCGSDTDCGAGALCTPPTIHAWRLYFSAPVRLIAIKMRGCGWCGGKVSVEDADRNLIVEREFGGEGDCGACHTFTLPVQQTGADFYISDATFAPFSLRSAISFQYEGVATRWEERQLLPSVGASDSEFFVINGTQYLAVAHYRAHESCFGDVECTNPAGADPLVKDTVTPYNIESKIWRFNGTDFEEHQGIATRGSLDMEHFQISGEHYLVSANNFDSSRSSAETTSTVFRWQVIPPVINGSNVTSAGPSGNGSNVNGSSAEQMDPTANETNASEVRGFVPYQEIPTHDVRKVVYFQKDGQHYLIVIGSPSKAREHGSVLWRWDGVKFTYAGELGAGEASAVSVFSIDDALYIAVAVAQSPRGVYSTNSGIYRWQDAAQWHGAIEYSDAFSPEAHFPVRHLAQDSTVADGENNITLTLTPDRIMPAGTTITLSNLVGSLTTSGSYLLAGRDSHLFANKWTFSAETARFEMVASASIPAGIAFVVGFVLRNGPGISDPIRAVVSSSGGEITFFPAAVSGRILGVATLPDAAVTHFTVVESSSIRNDMHNTLRFSLRANRALPKGVVLEIRGLTGSATRGTGLTFAITSAPEHSAVVPQTGIWTQTSGTLSITLNATLPPFAYLAFSATLANPDVKQTPKAATLRVLDASSNSLFPDIASAVSLLSGAVPPSLVVARITSQHSVRGARDILTVAIQPSVPILAGATFKIAGVKAAETDGTVIALQGRHGERFYTGGVYSAETKSQLAILQTLNFQVGPNCTTDCTGGSCPPNGAASGLNGREHGRDCRFPFTFDGVEYSFCTAVGSPDGRAWCGTASTVPGTAAAGPSGSWGYCACHDAIPAGEITTFSFALTAPLALSPGSQPTIAFAGRVVIPAVPMTDASGERALVLAASSDLGALFLHNGSALSAGTRAAPWPELAEGSIEAWVKVGAGTGQNLIALSPGMSLSSTATPNEVEVSIGGSAIVFSSVGFDNGAWHHLAATWSNLNGRLALLLDGGLVSSQLNVETGTTLSLSASSLTLGGMPSSSPGLDLTLAEVRCWSVAWTDAEVAALYPNFLVGEAAPQALLAHYDFTLHGSDSSIYNSTLSSPSIPGGAEIVPVPRAALPLHAAIAPTAAFTTLSASSSSSRPGGDSCVTIAMAATVALGPGAAVTVSGLTGMQTRVALLPAVVESATRTLAEFGVWDQDAGSIVFILEAPVSTGGAISMRFTLINAPDMQPARMLFLRVKDGSLESYGNHAGVSGPAVLGGMVLEMTTDACSPATVPAWAGQTCPVHSTCTLSATPPCTCASACPMAAWKRLPQVVGSHLVTWETVTAVTDTARDAGATNNVSFVIQPDRSVPAGSLITVSGLTGSMTADRSADAGCAITGRCFVQVSGDWADSFDLAFGSWQQAGGTLILRLAKALPATEAAHLSIVLQNSLTQQGHVTPSIALSGPVNVPEVFMCGSVMGVDETAGRFLVASINETSCHTCQKNTLSVALRGSQEIAVGSVITIVNMSGTLSGNASVPLHGVSKNVFVDGLGAWDGVSSLTLTVAQTIPAHAEVFLSFTLQNGNVSRPAAVPFIQLTSPGVSTLEPFSRMAGHVLAFGGGPRPDVESVTSWMATGWAPQLDVENGGVIWVQEAQGSCCAGACCEARTCCGCSSLFASGLEEYSTSGLYFAGSPCEVYCDMDTGGGGWTLISTATNADAVNWEETARESMYAVPHRFETNLLLFGSPDPSLDADFRGWAFWEASGDGMGAGDQVMITTALRNESAQHPLLQTGGGCLGDDAMATHLSSLAWDCAASDYPTFSLDRAATVDNNIPGPASCAHACPLARSYPNVSEGALLGGVERAYLFLKAGAEDMGASDAARMYLSTELSTLAGDGRGIGSRCHGSACASCAGGSCGSDVSGNGEEGGLTRRYSVWVRRSQRWTSDCDLPLRREGISCACCGCEAGMSPDGAKCVECPAARFLDSADDEPCAACPGTEALGEGQDECVRSVELFVATGAGGIDQGIVRTRDVANASNIFVSIQWAETGEWSLELEIERGVGFGAWETARQMWDPPPAFMYIGTPINVRYRLGWLEHDSSFWAPLSVAVRVHGGGWFETAGALAQVNALCPTLQDCATSPAFPVTNQGLV